MPRYVVIYSEDGIVQEVQIFQSEDLAVGYAQSKYGNGSLFDDDAVVFKIDDITGSGTVIYTVAMWESHNNDNVAVDDVECLDLLEDDLVEEGPIKSVGFSLVNAEELYGMDILPSKEMRQALKKGMVVQVAVSTMDTHEMCHVQIMKVVNGKRRRYEGKLLDKPSYFTAPSKMRIKFSPENVISIEKKQL